MTAEDVLTVLNDMEPVDVDDLVFCVVTAGSAFRHGAGGRVIKTSEQSWWPFERGEVLVISKETDREPFGQGRKPAKWDVDVHDLPDFTAAAELGKLVQAEDTVPGWYWWTGSEWQPVTTDEVAWRRSDGADWRLAAVLRPPGVQFP